MRNMADKIDEAFERDHERRSGLPGLGGRPRMHPAWGEEARSVHAGEDRSKLAWPSPRAKASAMRADETSS